MEEINTTIKSDNRIKREEEWVYLSKDNLGLKNYQEIKDKFYGEPFLSHIHLDRLRDLRCKVNAILNYRIIFNEKELCLFSNKLIIENMEDEEIRRCPMLGECDEKEINEEIKKYNGKFTIKVVVDIMYYKRLALWDYRID